MPNAQVLYHSSIKLSGSKVIYIDPYEIQGEPKDADYIFCTHPHYDHFSPKDIQKVWNNHTIFIIAESAKQEAVLLLGEERVKGVEPDHSYQIENLMFETKNAYNKDKPYHPKDKHWVGYVIHLDKVSYYISGDTDNIPEIQNVICDVAFLPIGGTYTMDVEEAAKLANTLQAETIIPTHYGSIVGKKEDGKKFANLVTTKKVLVML